MISSLVGFYQTNGFLFIPVSRYDEALSFHQQALVLKPLNPSTYSAIGFVQVIINHQKQQEATDFLQSLTGDLMGAVESFHKALGIRR